jgi:hypothetical protein
MVQLFPTSLPQSQRRPPALQILDFQKGHGLDVTEAQCTDLTPVQSFLVATNGNQHVRMLSIGAYSKSSSAHLVDAGRGTSHLPDSQQLWQILDIPWGPDRRYGHSFTSYHSFSSNTVMDCCSCTLCRQKKCHISFWTISQD